jgi:hypothetical protein
LPFNSIFEELLETSTFTDVENYVEVVDNFLYLNLYSVLWKPMPYRKPLGNPPPAPGKKSPAAGIIQIV